MFDVRELDCISGGKKKERKATVLGKCPNSLGLLILSQSILKPDPESGRLWDEVSEGFAKGCE